MTENQTDGAVSGGGQGGEPSQPSSPPTPKPFDGDVNALLATLDGKFDSRFKTLEDSLQKALSRTEGLRKAQGDIDKTQTTLREWLAKVDQYEKQGMSRDEAVAAIESNTASEQRWTNLEKKLEDLAARIASGGTQANDSNAVAKVFESLGLDLKDVRVASALARKYDNPDQVELAAYRLQRELASTNNPSPAQAASMQGGAGGVNTVEAKITRLSQLQDDPFGNMKEIKKLTAELDAVNWGDLT